MTDKLQKCIELICEQGCDSVRTVIRQLEAHKKVDMIENFSGDETEKILKELREIMSVYDDK